MTYDSPWSHHEIEMRRRFWFKRVQERFNLVKFDRIADWLCREGNGIDRNEARRIQILADLETAAQNGEFDTRRDWPKCRISSTPRPIVWLPTMPGSLDSYGRDPGHWTLRVSAGQISWWGLGSASIVPELAAPAPMVAAWFARYGFPIPLWLAEMMPAADALPAMSERAASGVAALATTTKQPFNAKKVKARLVAEKLTGSWKEKRPPMSEVAKLLGQDFNLPSESLRKVWKAVWPERDYGPFIRGKRPNSAAAN